MKKDQKEKISTENAQRIAESAYTTTNHALEKANTARDNTIAWVASLESKWDKVVVATVTEIATRFGQALFEKEAFNL